MKKKLFIAVLIVVLAVTASMVTLYVYWDVKRQKQALEDALSAAINRPVRIGDVRFQAFPAMSVVLQDVTVKDRDALSVCLTIEQAHIGMSFMQLFHRIVQFDTLTLHRPRFILTRDASKRLSVDDLVNTFFPQKTLPRQEGTSWIKEFRFFMDEAAIVDGSITFKDYALSQTPLPVTVEDINLRTGTFSPTKAAPITLECTVRREDRAAKIAFDGLAGPLFPKASMYSIPWKGRLNMSDIPLGYFRPYLSGWEKIGSLQGLVDGEFVFDGTVAGDFTASGSFVGKDISIERSDVFAHHLRLKNVHGKGDIMREGQTLTIPSLTVAVPGISAAVNGSMLTAEPWSIDMTVKSENVDYLDLLSYLPVSLFSDRVKNVLTKKVQAGTVESFILHYTGTRDGLLLDNGRGALRDLEAAVLFRDILLVFAEDIPEVENLKGTITYVNKKCVLGDVTGSMGASKLERGELTLSPEGVLTGTAAFALNLGDLDRIVHSESLYPRVKHELRSLERIDGGGRLIIDVSGPIDEPGTLDYTGDLTLFDAVIDYRDFRKTLTAVNGRITFDSSLLTIHPSEGFWARSPVVCYGKIEQYRTRQSEVEIHVESDQARLEDLSSAFFSWMDHKKENVVSAEIDFYCKGYRKDGFSFNGSADFEGQSFSMPPFPYPFADVQGAMTFSGDGLTFNQVRGKINSSDVVFTGAWKNFNEPVMTGKIEGTFADLNDFLKSPEAGGMSSRPLFIDDVALYVKEGRYRNLFVSEVRTFINYSDGVFTFPSLRVGSGHFYGFEFETVHNVDGNHLYPVTFQNDVITIPFLNLSAGSGTWIGTEVHIPCAPESPVPYSLTSTISSFPVERIMQWFPPDHRGIVTGTLDLEGTVAGRGETFHEAVKNLEGAAEFSIKKGILKKAKILSKIFSLLNVSRMFSQNYADLLDNGIHFNTIDGSCQIEKGVLHTESVLLDSAAMKMDALGALDLGNRTVNMEISVQPFETVDKVLGKIPILGTVLMGEEGALVVSYYKLEGPLADPDLHSVVFQSLGRKGQSIFKSIYNIPDNVLISPSKSLWDKVRGNGKEEGDQE